MRSDRHQTSRLPVSLLSLLRAHFRSFHNVSDKKQNIKNVSSLLFYIQIWRIYKKNSDISKTKQKRQLCSAILTLWSNQYPALIFTTLESDSAVSSTLKCYKSSAGADEIMITDGNQACRIRRHRHVKAINRNHLPMGVRSGRTVVSRFALVMTHRGVNCGLQTQHFLCQGGGKPTLFCCISRLFATGNTHVCFPKFLVRFGSLVSNRWFSWLYARFWGRKGL